jgi:hypothetical protein
VRILEAPGSGKTSRAICPRSWPILALAPRIVRPPPPTPALYAGHAVCDAVDGGETSVLLEPRSTAYDSTVLLESKLINRFFHLGHATVLTPALLGLAGEPFGFALRRRGVSAPSGWRSLRIRFAAKRRFGLVLSAGSCPRGTAQPSRSRYTRARSGPDSGFEKSRGQIAARSGSPERCSGRISRESGLAGHLAQAHADPQNPAMGDSWRAVSSFAMELN